MELWEIILYSFTQGVTEFLPISSSAHLFTLERLLNWSISGRTLAISAHLGSLLAVCIYLKKDLIKILGRGSLKVKINVTAHYFSASSVKVIEKLGGKVKKVND